LTGLWSRLFCFIRYGRFLTGEGHRIKLFLLVGGKERLDLCLGILDLLLYLLTLGFQLLLDFRHLLLDNRLDFGLLIIRQGKFFREMIENAIGHLGRIGRAVFIFAHHAGHARPTEVVEALPGVHLMLPFKPSAVSEARVVFMMMMDDCSHHEQEQNQHVESQACNG